MSDIEILSTVIGIVGTVLAIVFGYSAWKRNQKTDDTSTGENKGTMLTEIGYIKSGIDDIKRKQDKQDERNIEVITRMTAVEASAKQAHKRLDRLEGRVDREE